jgi:hypothetical protein
VAFSITATKCPTARPTGIHRRLIPFRTLPFPEAYCNPGLGIPSCERSVISPLRVAITRRSAIALLSNLCSLMYIRQSIPDLMRCAMERTSRRLPRSVVCRSRSASSCLGRPLCQNPITYLKTILSVASELISSSRFSNGCPAT